MRVFISESDIMNEVRFLQGQMNVLIDLLFVVLGFNIAALKWLSWKVTVGLHFSTL
jgi:hypothetical protein